MGSHFETKSRIVHILFQPSAQSPIPQFFKHQSHRPRRCEVLPKNMKLSTLITQIELDHLELSIQFLVSRESPVILRNSFADNPIFVMILNLSLAKAVQFSCAQCIETDRKSKGDEKGKRASVRDRSDELRRSSFRAAGGQSVKTADRKREDLSAGCRSCHCLMADADA